MPIYYKEKIIGARHITKGLSCVAVPFGLYLRYIRLRRIAHMLETLFAIALKIFKKLLTNTTNCRILYRMKVTAIIPDNIISEVKQYSHGKNITESLIIALSEWLSLKKIKELNNNIQNNPLEFNNYNAELLRNINRM